MTGVQTCALPIFRQGRERASFDLFELALSHDVRAGQLFEEAAVATAYAFCLRGAGQIPLGAFQLHRAYDALCRWGAPPLAGELAERHPELATWIRPGSLSVAGGSPRFVDVNAIIQAGSELAGATSSDELVRRTLELLLKAGGATKARLWRKIGRAAVRERVEISVCD